MSSRLEDLTRASRRRDERTARSRRSASPQESRRRSPERERSKNYNRDSRDSRDSRDDRDRDRDRVSRRERQQEEPAGDGGWGTRARDLSPGRPSLALPSQQSLATNDGDRPRDAVKVIEPNFAPSGALAAETNTFQGVVLKYNEPPEARKPVRQWRLYVFKGKEQLGTFTRRGICNFLLTNLCNRIISRPSPISLLTRT